ncbi:hypothetical protein BOX15_Mlig033065g2, partial [Macrostomum lignano]
VHMFKLKQQQAAAAAESAGGGGGGGGRTRTISTSRDRLLLKEMSELQEVLTQQRTTLHLPNPSVLSEFVLTISPAEGLWAGGHFKFIVRVPEAYNLAPPEVTCQTRVWHPNVSEQGEVCLSLLRLNSIDDFGWYPTRTLKDVVLGLESLFTDLCDFHDALNAEAADQYRCNPQAFKLKVSEYIRRYACRK